MYSEYRREEQTETVVRYLVPSGATWIDAQDTLKAAIAEHNADRGSPNAEPYADALWYEVHNEDIAVCFRKKQG